VAASAAAIQHRFDGFTRVGNTIGTAVSASFLIILGMMNIYILNKLVQELRRIISGPRGRQVEIGFEGAGCLFAIFYKMFRLVDR
jgi:high-affinity nickel-transport protein